MSTTSSISERIAKFSCMPISDLPAELIEAVRSHIVDTFVVMVAGRCTSVGSIVASQVLEESGGCGPGWLVGSASGAPSASCAFANGVATHALDFDDDDPLLVIGHPSGPVLSALLAIAMSVRPSGRQIVESYLVGVEAQMQLGAEINPAHYDRGWHATATLGALGAAVASSRLLGLHVEETRCALGLAAAGANGLRANFGTMAKPIQVGNASRVGLDAALLAKRGVTAALDSLDGPLGYLAVACEELPGTPADFLDGQSWTFLNPGLAIKRYASCSNTHTAIDGILQLRAETETVNADLDRIVCRVSPGTETNLIYHRPKTGL